jgi:hypothetical protein
MQAQNMHDIVVVVVVVRLYRKVYFDIVAVELLFAMENINLIGNQHR